MKTFKTTEWERDTEADKLCKKLFKQKNKKIRRTNKNNLQFLRASLEGSLQRGSKDNEAVHLIQNPDNEKHIIAKVNGKKFKKTHNNGSGEKGDVLKVPKKKRIKIDGSGKVLKKEWKKLVKKYSKDVDNLNKQSEQLHSQKEKEQERNKKLKLMLELVKQKASTEKLVIPKSNPSSSKVDTDIIKLQKLKDIQKQQNMLNSNSLTEQLVKSNQNLSLKLKKKQQFYGKLRQTLEETKAKKPVLSLRQKMMEKLKAARFRFLNEQIYTANSKEAQKIFQSDPEAFKAYHEGYRQQIKSWPLNPLDYIIRSIKKMPKFYTIADFGCGDAKLAPAVEQKVHSFDLVAVNESVVACDMSSVPLEDGSVDVAVFCLSLMGTNLNDYILEANRVLKVGGTLKIAEVESRFENIEDFVKGLQQFGFRNVWRDLSHNLFYFLDFTKVVNVKSKKKLPTLSLLPCLYKKR